MGRNKKDGIKMNVLVRDLIKLQLLLGRHRKY